MFASQSAGVLNAVLESSIVIVEGVTLVLIDKEEEEKRKPSWGHAFISMTAGTHSVLTACRLSLWAFAAWICVHLHSLHWNVLLVSAVLNWLHLSGRCGIIAIEGGEKGVCVCGSSLTNLSKCFLSSFTFHKLPNNVLITNWGCLISKRPTLLLTYGALVLQRWEIGALVHWSDIG